MIRALLLVALAGATSLAEATTCITPTDAFYTPTPRGCDLVYYQRIGEPDAEPLQLVVRRDGTATAVGEPVEPVEVELVTDMHEIDCEGRTVDRYERRERYWRYTVPTLDTEDGDVVWLSNPAQTVTTTPTMLDAPATCEPHEQPMYYCTGSYEGCIPMAGTPDDEGGCATSGSGGGLALGLLALRRRRRR